jgi:hypothetical protein
VTDSTCTVCNEQANEVFSYKTLNDHQVILAKCRNCGFLFVPDSEWVEGSFDSELNRFDLGSVDRSIIVADFVESISRSSKSKSLSFLDWGGGYGLLTRLCRDRGIDMVNFDPYVRPIFSGPAQVDELIKREVLVASEVFLHLVDPLRELRNLLNFADYVLVTAVVPPQNVSTDWWYLMPDTGQHISFFPVTTLKELARRSGTFVYTDRRFFHLFSKQRLPLRQAAIVKWRSLLYLYVFWNYLRRFALRARGKSFSMTHGDQARVRGSQDETS